MNIYLENAGVIGNCRYVRKIAKLIGRRERIDLFLRTDRPISLFPQMLIVICVPTVKTMELTVPASKARRELIWFANRFARYSLRFVVDQPLTKRQWERICKLKDVTYIEDISGADHSALYASNRKVVCRSGSCDDMEKANIYSVAVKMPLKECTYSSCLGKTLYITKAGKVSYCKEYPQQTYLGEVGKLTKLFDIPQFMEHLKGMIAKRSQCRASCSHYQSCQGGCVFRQDCSAFRQDCDLAVNDISHLIESRCDLSELPIYKERSVIYRLFSRKHYDSSVE